MFKNITSNLGESRCVRVWSYLGACVDDGAVMFENITCYLASVAAVCARACVFLPARVSMAEPLRLKHNLLPGRVCRCLCIG